VDLPDSQLAIATIVATFKIDIFSQTFS